MTGSKKVLRIVVDSSLNFKKPVIQNTNVGLRALGSLLQGQNGDVGNQFICGYIER